MEPGNLALRGKAQLDYTVGFERVRDRFLVGRITGDAQRMNLRVAPEYPLSRLPKRGNHFGAATQARLTPSRVRILRDDDDGQCDGQQVQIAYDEQQSLSAQSGCSSRGRRARGSVGGNGADWSPAEIFRPKIATKTRRHALRWGCRGTHGSVSCKSSG